MKLQRKFEQKAKKIITAGALVMVIFFQICLVFISKMYYKDKYLNELKAKFKERTDEAAVLQTMSEKTRTIRNFIPIRFTDARINGGATTEAFLEVLAENLSFQEHRIEIVRVIFNDEDTNLPKALLSTTYPEWADSATLTPPIPTSSAPGKIERKIAALENKIRQIKKNARLNSPRLNFYRLSPGALRQIAALERQIAVLKRKLPKGAR